MPTQSEIERMTREVLKQSNPDLRLRSVEPLPVNQDDELWDIVIECPRCIDRDIIVLTQKSAGNVPEQIRQKIQEHLATH